jgi:hypothetical protein
VIACRSGLYIFFNKGYAPTSRDINYLPNRESYPSHEQWEAPQRPTQKKKP